MTRYRRGLWDRLTQLKQLRHTVMPKIMEVQIIDAEHLTGACECRADGIGRVWEVPRSGLGHELDDRGCFGTE